VKAHRTLPVLLVVLTTTLTSLLAAAPARADGAADHLAFDQHPPATVTAGQAFSPAVTVDVLNAGGGLVTDQPVDVSLALSGGTVGAILTGGGPVTSVNGVATFVNLTVDKVGTAFQLTATASGLTPDPVSSTFDVLPGNATHLAFDQQPSNVMAGDVITPSVTVQVLDADGNLVTSPVNVSLALSGGDPGATLGGTTTRTSSGGVATFDDLTVDKVGTGYQLDAAASGLSGDTSSTFDVLPGNATHLAFDQQPSNVNAGEVITPSVTVQVLDGDGNLVTSPVDVSLALSGGDPGATLGGTTTRTSSGGVATFDDLTVDKVGTGYQLDASTTGLVGDSSAGFDVQAAAATTLDFNQQPTNTPVGQIIQPAITVDVHDAYGNLVTNPPAGKVTIVIDHVPPSNGALHGDNQQSVIDGEVRFSQLWIDKPGTGYTLRASGLGLTPAVSDPFNIKGPTTVTLSVGTHLVAVGQQVRLVAHLSNCLDGCALMIYQTPYGGSKTLIASGHVDANKNLATPATMNRNSTFVAAFAGDSRWLPANSNVVKVNAHVLIYDFLQQGGYHGYYDTRNGYRLFHYHPACAQDGLRCPMFHGEVTPPLEGAHLSFALQAYSGGRWQTIATTIATVGGDGVASVIWRYLDGSVRGVPLRTRSWFKGNNAYAAYTGKWRYFKVV
jgi:hypothetical protein